ncbi:MAG: prolipoprotein diacylglyceryl transferase [Patescibacteria group bacterium]
MFSYKKTILFLVIPAFLLAAFIFFYLFPAFRGQIAVKPDFYLGPVRLHFYSLTFLLAVVAAYFFLRRYGPNFGLDESAVEDLLLYNLLAGFAGARIHHVFSLWSYYSAEPLAILEIWEGGLGIFGGVAGGAAATFLYCRYKKISFLRLADLLAPALILGQAIGRWGNFFNQEAYGLPTTLPWKMFVEPVNRAEEFLGWAYFHPLFLYESLWNLLVFFILLRLFRTKTDFARGKILAGYLILYSVGRFGLENLRADPTLLFGHPANQILAVIFIALGAAILIIGSRVATLPGRGL